MGWRPKIIRILIVATIHFSGDVLAQKCAPKDITRMMTIQFKKMFNDNCNYPKGDNNPGMFKLYYNQF